MSDPVYNALYEEVSDTLERAEVAVQKAMKAVNERLSLSEQTLQDIKKQANKLDGNNVFISRDGKSAFTENGQKLSDQQMLLITTNHNAPSWEEYQAAKQEYDKAANNVEEIHNYQENILKPSHDRLNDKDNQPSTDELKNILNGIESNMPEVIKDHIENESNYEAEKPIFSVHEAKSYFGGTGLNAPDVNMAFNTARLDIPDLELEPAPKPEQAPMQQQVTEFKPM